MKKKMMQVGRTVDGRILVEVNSSSLSVMQECQRKADFIINHHLVSEASTAQEFGSLVHKTIADWYLSPRDTRTPELMAEFWNSNFEYSGYVSDNEKKTKETGLRALMKYAEVMKNEPMEVVTFCDMPMVEFQFDVELASLPLLEIRLFGTIDLVVRNTETGEVFVMDHKTTSSLGEQFMNLWKPNHQMTGYIHALKCLGFECSKALINGIQIVKTKQEFCRVETHRTEEDLAEFKETVVSEVKRFLLNKAENFYPAADSYTCSSFSGCQFLSYCQSSKDQRDRMISAKKQELEGLLNGATRIDSETYEHFAGAC